MRSTRSVFGIEGAAVDLLDAIGGELEQPLGLDRRAQPHLDDPGARLARAGVAALLGVDGDQPVAGGFVAELGGAARREHDGARARLAAARDAIGKRGQDREAQRLRRRAAPTPVARSAAADRAAGARGRPPRSRGDPAPAGAARRRGSAPRAACWNRSTRSSTSAPRSDARAAGRRRTTRARRWRMSRSAISAAARHAAAPTPRASPSTTSRASRGWTGRRDMRRPTSVRRPSPSTAPSRREQLARRAPRRGGRRLEPGERVRVADAQRRQRQRHLGQIGARDLGLGRRARRCSKSWRV